MLLGAFCGTMDRDVSGGRPMSRYIFDTAAAEPTAQRFASLEALYDPRTIRLLEATGIGPGWRCLEVGGGSGSIAAWLADRVGPAGHGWGRSLYQRFVGLGLTAVGMEGHLVARPGGSPGARLDAANFAQVGEAAIAAGLLAAEELDRMLALLDDPACAFASPTLFTAWGRRP
jgi:hypothetical protein